MQIERCYICDLVYVGKASAEDRCGGHVDLRDHLKPSFQAQERKRRREVEKAIRHAAIEAAKRYVKGNK